MNNPSRGTHKWIDYHIYDDTEEAIESLHHDGFLIYAAVPNCGAAYLRG